MTKGTIMDEFHSAQIARNLAVCDCSLGAAAAILYVTCCACSVTWHCVSALHDSVGRALLRA